MDPAVKKGFSEDGFGDCFRGSSVKNYSLPPNNDFNIYKKRRI
jgi:hypothetical protein